ncbi:UDP-N-acetylmuramate--L-alanine ligase [Kordiimonas sediminis]|uniref:UDP-N-acetylmuramate--L-alanine ligase n=1 Tax=Kordiimonas sediminis TaxID=1735581 RepID=A0A919AT90_9PROT|nr:UDP-N-acetylmuramate--L-alanine ligase [Kordiimonas sediminis]GHF23155.1 UDP-N-acetylmuramate--L-alanine ligase [Kordiimonas sediminis]
MKNIPFDIGIVHFIGIGGIGMSGIAEVMHNLGYKVQGSDLAKSANVERLMGLGIPVMVGQGPENIGDSKVIVVSSAIKADNPELIEARRLGLPVVRRAEMLAELMRLKWCVSVAGTHGKTTTTSMVATVLEHAGIDPTVINGGIINSYGTNARLGEGNWMVVEADESDGTFVKLPATIAIVTNMDPEHLDFYGTFENEKAAFKQFLERVPFYGAAIMCIDHPEVQALIPEVKDRKVVSYGLSAQADIQATNVRSGGGSVTFDVRLLDRQSGDRRTISDIQLPMPGNHNIQNALAAIAAGLEMGASDDVLRAAFSAFGGVKRRFTKTGVVNGVTFIDDYGHHPVEIESVLKAARSSFEGRVIAVVQPHRYSRLQSLFEEFCTCFNDADTVLVSPVFAAGEEPLEGFNSDTLAEGLRDHGHRDAVAFASEEDIPQLIASRMQAGDVVVFLGAGSITKWAVAAPEQVNAHVETGG